MEVKISLLHEIPAGDHQRRDNGVVLKGKLPGNLPHAVFIVYLLLLNRNEEVKVRIFFGVSSGSGTEENDSIKADSDGFGYPFFKTLNNLYFLTLNH